MTEVQVLHCASVICFWHVTRSIFLRCHLIWLLFPLLQSLFVSLLIFLDRKECRDIPSKASCKVGQNAVRDLSFRSVAVQNRMNTAI